MECEPRATERFSQFPFQGKAAAHFGFHVQMEEAKGIFSFAFGAVHGHVAPLHQGIDRALGAEGGAQAARGVMRYAVDVEGFAHCVEDLYASHGNVVGSFLLGLPDVLEQDDEFVSRNARDRVTGPGAGADAFCHLQ